MARVALLVAGSLNTLDQMHARDRFTMVDVLEDLGIEYDTFICTSFESAFKTFPKEAYDEKENTIYDWPIVGKFKENSYAYTVGRHDKPKLKHILKRAYQRILHLEVSIEEDIMDEIPLNGEELDDAIKRFNHMYWFAYKMKRVANVARKHENDYDFFVYIRPDAFVDGGRGRAGTNLKKFFDHTDREQPIALTRVFEGATTRGTVRGAISQKSIVFTRGSIHALEKFFDQLHLLDQRVYQCRDCADVIYADSPTECPKCSKTRLNFVSDGLSEYKLYQQMFREGVEVKHIGFKFQNLR